ncbi:hypothetical protein TUM22923_02570 [Polynucleobacter sp. TUM22923]|nr:hypothetical protein TUM22923_02570 [Polynucleobacter sp. TUM22923]
MLEVQAVLGRIQLGRMADWAAVRAQNALAIGAACQPFTALRVPGLACEVCTRQCTQAQACVHAHYKRYVYVNPDALAPGWSRDRIVEAINALSVPCYQGSCSEVYLEKAFDNKGWRPELRLPVAQALGETSLMFLVHPTLTHEEIQKTCDAISRVMAQASV